MEVLDKQNTAVAAYQPFYAQLTELEKANANLVFDYEDKRGNKEARSHVNSLRLTKGALERTRKEAKEESLRIGRAVDSEAKEINARIEAMISVHQAKLDEIDQREKDRISSIQTRLDALSDVYEGRTSEFYRQHIAEVEAIVIDESWQEFEVQAARAKDASISKHRAMLAAQELAEAEAVELARLRAAEAARAQIEREERIAKEAADRATVEAEKKAKAERDAVEKRELELRLAAETAERRRIEAEQKAEQDAKDAAIQAEQATAKAIKDEQARVAANQKAEDDERARREANKAHKAKINRAALAALVNGGVTEEMAQLCVTLIAKGEVPAIQINY